MPFRSQAQRGYMHIHHPEIAKRWDKDFPNQGKLPEHVKKTKKVKNKYKEALKIEKRVLKKHKMC